MKKIYLALLLLVLPLFTRAQIGVELIANGGFEEYPPEQPNDDDDDDDEEGGGTVKPAFDPYLKPKFWYFNSSLSYSRTQDAHTGIYAIKLYPNGGSFFSRDKDFNINHIPVAAGGEYTVTYWYKGNVKKPNIIVTVDWYKGTRIVKKDTRARYNDKVQAVANEWRQKTLTFTAPSGVETAGLGFTIEYDSESAGKSLYILIDDISMIQTKAGTEQITPEPPSNLKASSQQREITLTWNAIADETASYVISKNGTVIDTVSLSTYIATKLEPLTTYTFSVRTLKNGVYSTAEQLTQTTQPMNRGIDEEDRIPYLYTIREQGTCPRRLPLYYNDLAVPDAKMKYWIDDVEVMPINNSIIFSTSGSHILRIEIEETIERKWEIEYKLTVD